MLNSQTNERLTKLSDNAFLAVVRDCAACEDVRAEVQANYAENRWWPTSIADWRVRMLIAGWSTRVSYNHIAHYQGVVRAVSEIGWEKLVAHDDETILAIVAPLGLGASRIKYLRSLAVFVDNSDGEARVFQRSNDDAIEDFQSMVEGAGYKVAQCAVLYAKGYHCGIIPIDSGMAEMLTPLIPQQLPTGPIRHEIIRKWMERAAVAASSELHDLAGETDTYLGIDRQTPPTWWVHLLLIYYKRLYWNRRRLAGPFRRSPVPVLEEEALLYEGEALDTASFPGLVVEGLDGTGKSTVADLLTVRGYQYSHAPYEPSGDTFDRYERQIQSMSAPAVLDRSFVSEYVYGRVRRGHTRLSLDSCLTLCEMLARRGVVVFYLDEEVDVIAARRPDFQSDLGEINRLRREYRQFFSAAARVIPVYPIRLSQLAPGYILRFLEVGRSPHESV